MNRIKYLIAFAILIASLTEITFAQGDLKSNLTSLFELSKAKSFEKAAALIAYNGDDKNRLFKDSFDSSNKEELNQAKRECKKISSLIELSSKYEIGNSIIVNKNEGDETASIDVTFYSADQKLVKTYTFIKTAKGYLLSNMN